MLLDVNIDSDKTSLNLVVDGNQKRIRTPEDLWDALWAACAREARQQSQSSNSALRLVPATSRTEKASKPPAVDEDVIDAEMLDGEPSAEAPAQAKATDGKRSLRDRIRQDGADKVVDEVFDDAMVHLGVEAFRMTVGAVGAVQNIFGKKKRKKKRAVSAQATGKNSAPRGQETRIKRWLP